MFENPFLSGKGIYFSQSRSLSAHHGEWLTFDPMLKWNPENLLSNPTDMNGFKYVNGDPVNFVDPSGYYSVNAEWFVFADLAMGVQKSRGFALTYSSKDKFQFDFYTKKSELKFTAGAGLSTGFSVEFGNARNLKDLSGRSFGFEGEFAKGIGGNLGFSKGTAEDGKDIFTFGGGMSFGGAAEGGTGIYNTTFDRDQKQQTSNEVQ